jgi:8-oxo-dGTP pyrophosphatase MutT (NUDIX family)
VDIGRPAPGEELNLAEGEGEGALRAAAVRELHEEAGIRVPATSELVPFSRWITPAEVKIRFDTWFFLTALPPDAESKVDGSEIVEARWYEPVAALEAGERGEILLVFPTIKHLEQLSGFASAEELLAFARTQVVRPIEPHVVVEGETARILLPGEPGYDAGE